MKSVPVTIDLSPFSFLVNTNIPLVVDNLFRIYPDSIVSHGESIKNSKVCSYTVSAISSSGVRKIVKPQARFLCDQKEPFKPLAINQGYALLEWGMNWTVAAMEMQHVITHSAVLARENKAILFPAPPGSGKSTLTAYLVYKNWRLLSDEMALIQPHSNTVYPFVRPICLKNRSIEIAKKWFAADRFSSIAPNTHKGDVIHLSPPDPSWSEHKSPAKICGIVFPKYKAGSELKIYKLTMAEGFMEFASNAFNYGVIGATGFKTISNILEDAPVFEVEYSDLEEVKEFLEEDIIANA